MRARPRSSEYVSIHVEGRFAFEIHRDLLLEFDLAPGRVLDAGRQAEIVRRNAFFRARATAARFLAYRDRTVSEVRKCLQQEGCASEVVEAVVGHFERTGQLDDRRFAMTYADVRFHSGGYGPDRVRADLRRKGIGSTHVDGAIHAVFGGDEALLERMREMGRVRWDRLSAERDVLKRKRKVRDYLVRRGFPFELACRAVNDLANETP